MKPRIYKPSETDFSNNGLGILSDCSRCEVYEVANGKYELELEYPLGTRFDEYFENDYQIKAKPNDQEEYHIFFIDDKDIDTFMDTVTIYAQSRTNRLGRRVVTTAQVDSKTAQEAMNIIENNMDKKSDIRLYSDNTTVSSTLFEARNVLNCIAGEQGSLLQFWGGEIKREPFKLSLLKRRGRNNVGTIRYGKDLSGLKVKLDWTGVKTRIIPYVDAQGAEGTSNRIYGSTVDSEFINNYPDVYSEHVQFTEEQGAKDLKSLNNVAKNYFKSINPGCDKPKISITIEFDKLTDSEEAKEFANIRNYGLFDTFKVYHKKYKLYFESTVSGVQYDSLSEKTTKLEAGDTQVAFYQQQAITIQDKLKDYATNNYMSGFNDYVSSMITGQGSAGGYVVLWPKEKPSNIFIMDNPDLNKAKEVLRMNKNGIAFSKNGWNGPFNSAWTLDSIFNANFIKAGIIQADVFENSFNKTGDTLKLVNGLLQIWNNKKKIMELTKKGMQFWSGSKEIGTIGTTDSTGNPFPNASTPTPIPDNALVIRTEGDGKYILISPNKNKGFVMLANGTTIHFGDMNIQGKVQIYKDVDIKGKLTINGQEVFPGQGGGGNNNGGSWNGMYPPEVTSQADKFAWELWVILLSKGYSKAAAAGILANVQGEAGVSMNPDIAQIGGPAYGIVQWDGSAYPLVGAPTYNGREYVQRLMGAAGITEDYRTMSAQGNLLDWTMYNGQWLGIVQPATQSGFKTMTDPGAAAYTFERNYERPANAHPERQGWAVNWYNKFKDLQIQSGGNILSTAKSLIGYFHYSQPMRWNFGSVENPDRNGYADCSSFVWLALTKAGYRTAPRGTLWYTGSMRDDARGARQYLTEVSPNEAKAGDIIIVNLGAGAGNDGHTAVLAEDWHGYTTAIVEMGGMQSGGVGVGRVDLSFGYLLNGGDVCLARAKK
ncbi:phage tail spike protein [Enterococcus avium]|uniref:phage tail spike protein n=1 Tax=Enterococcus avium TaxID=33945 RepID=UPI00288E4C1C|nr:phage tail spike protein [Enterococcus avium]MDT2411576.1 phage tail spike protein [Enterococcus avium]MDT2415531.1 phage tail spike protein [Enterococcus avium]MDT2446457.1 phage tail spike protein [Enterococcus avium]MDT2476761.1 phage tail spike protein [Enterococcus avium]